MGGMPKRSSKKPRDLNQLAKAIVDEATAKPIPSTTPLLPPEPTSAGTAPSGKNPAAVELGRLGGRKGGVARARKLSAKKRSEIARKAAKARWSKKKKR